MKQDGKAALPLDVAVVLWVPPPETGKCQEVYLAPSAV